VTGLLPHAVREAVQQKTVFAASTSFGLVAFVLVVILMLELESIVLVRPGLRRASGFGSFLAPLLIAVLLTIVARLAHTVR
jgi:hypothetical protein